MFSHGLQDFRIAKPRVPVSIEWYRLDIAKLLMAANNHRKVLSEVMGQTFYLYIFYPPKDG